MSNRTFKPLELALMGLLSQQDRSGYDLLNIFSQTAMGGFSSSPGAIYPALKRLARAKSIKGVVENRHAIHGNILDFLARVLANRAAGAPWRRSHLGESGPVLETNGFEEARTYKGLQIIETTRRFLWNCVNWRQEPCFVRGVCRQLALNLDGWHIGHDVARFSVIRDWRAAFLAASSSSGMRSPVP